MAKKKIYRFKGNEGGKITDDNARKWIMAHQDYHAVKAHFYGKEIFQKILAQPGCVGIRIYYAMDDQNKKALVLIGADEKGKDILTTSKKATKGKVVEEDGGAYDSGFPCPPFCNGNF